MKRFFKSVGKNLGSKRLSAWFAVLSLLLVTALAYKLWPKPTPVEANNITATNISVSSNSSTKIATVTFSVNWANSYSLTYDGQAFWDCAWIFIKYSTTAGSDGSWQPAQLTTGGSVTPTADGEGACVRPGNNQTVAWNYGAQGVANGLRVSLRIGAIEMVYIPTGQYYYDAGGIGGTTANNFGGGVQTLVTSATQVPTGAPSNWPNGYNAFWIAKYEISQGQYVDFLNTISSTDAANRYLNSYNQSRNTITYNAAAAYGSRYSTTTPNRGCNFLSHDDADTYDAWAGLRPMTEMEFEKAARGTAVQSTNTQTYPWGNNDPSTGDYATYSFDGTTISEYYANFNYLSNGPVDVGHYLSGDLARTSAQTGASVYGVTDLSGNDWEQIINSAWLTTPLNGNGTTTIPASWPPYSSGFGLRGGGWDDSSGSLRISDRNYAAWAYSSRYYNVGARPARTAE